ncbi:MAG: hypothetical protein P8Y14_25575 [Anaerolineales bacterium]
MAGAGEVGLEPVDFGGAGREHFYGAGAAGQGFDPVGQGFKGGDGAAAEVDGHGGWRGGEAGLDQEVDDVADPDQVQAFVLPKDGQGGALEGVVDEGGDDAAGVAGAVDVGEAEDGDGGRRTGDGGRGWVMEGAEEGFGGEFAGAVEVFGPQAGVFFDGQAGGVAVDFARGGEYQARDASMPGQAGYAHGAQNVDGEGPLGVAQGAHDLGHGGQMVDDVDFFEPGTDAVPLEQVLDDELEAGVMQARGVPARTGAAEIVDDDHAGGAVVQQAIHQVAADEAGATGHQDPGPPNVVFAAFEMIGHWATPCYDPAGSWAEGKPRPRTGPGLR